MDPNEFDAHTKMYIAVFVCKRCQTFVIMASSIAKTASATLFCPTIGTDDFICQSPLRAVNDKGVSAVLDIMATMAASRVSYPKKENRPSKGN